MKRHDATSTSKYFDIEDAIKNFIHTGKQDWSPAITKIEEIKNTAMRIKFLETSLELFDPEPSPTPVWRFIQMSKSQLTEFESHNYSLVPKPFSTSDTALIVASRSTAGSQNKV